MLPRYRDDVILIGTVTRDAIKRISCSPTSVALTLVRSGPDTLLLPGVAPGFLAFVEGAEAIAMATIAAAGTADGASPCAGGSLHRITAARWSDDARSVVFDTVRQWTCVIGLLSPF